MNQKYDCFNEMMFESYTKKSIENGILKEQERKAEQRQREVSLSDLTDAILYHLVQADLLDSVDDDIRIFRVMGRQLIVHGDILGQAFSCLRPRDRDIVLLYYFDDMNDGAISKLLGMSLPTVHRRRHNAIDRLKRILEGRV